MTRKNLRSAPIPWRKRSSSAYLDDDAFEELLTEDIPDQNLRERLRERRREILRSSPADPAARARAIMNACCVEEMALYLMQGGA